VSFHIYTTIFDQFLQSRGTFSSGSHFSITQWILLIPSKLHSNFRDDGSDTERTDVTGRTIQITTPTEQQIEEYKVAISQGGEAYHNMMPLFQQMTNAADTDPYLAGNNNSSGNILSQPNVNKSGKMKKMNRCIVNC
jgi:hypothetical protein